MRGMSKDGRGHVSPTPKRKSRQRTFVPFDSASRCGGVAFIGLSSRPLRPVIAFRGDIVAPTCRATKAPVDSRRHAARLLPARRIGRQVDVIARSDNVAALSRLRMSKPRTVAWRVARFDVERDRPRRHLPVGQGLPHRLQRQLHIPAGREQEDLGNVPPGER